MISFSASQEKFKVDVTFYDDTEAEIGNVKILNATKTSNLGLVDENYSLKGVSNNKSEILSYKLPVSYLNYVNTRQGGFKVTKNKVEKNIFIPYEASIETLQVWRDGEKEDEYNLERKLCGYDGQCNSYCLGKGIDVDCTCGDSVCQDNESEELCPSDCGESSGPVDTDENQSVDGQEGSQSFWWLYVFLGCLLLVLLWLVFRSNL
jgi:hypothetical protein